MNYYVAGYGMVIVFQDRKYIKKTVIVNGRAKKKIVQRIFLEYMVPCRVAGIK
jgi:hypothetical protein